MSDDSGPNQNQMPRAKSLVSDHIHVHANNLIYQIISCGEIDLEQGLFLNQYYNTVKLEMQLLENSIKDALDANYKKYKENS